MLEVLVMMAPSVLTWCFFWYVTVKTEGVLNIPTLTQDD
jgi:hypothetical protein